MQDFQPSREAHPTHHLLNVKLSTRVGVWQLAAMPEETGAWAGADDVEFLSSTLDMAIIDSVLTLAPQPFLASTHGGWSFSSGNKCFLDIPLEVKGTITRWHRHVPSAPSAGICLHGVFCPDFHTFLQEENLLKAKHRELPSCLSSHGISSVCALGGTGWQAAWCLLL